MSTAVQKQTSAMAIEQVLLKGDLSKLDEEQRLQYYNAVCESVGLNPLTRPLEYMVLNGKLTLYVRKDGTDQLRQLRKVSVKITSREKLGDVYVVTAQAKLPDGREDESTGAIAIGTAKGETLANLFMKAETKAKRRVTLSICGLGLLDESEVESIPAAEKVKMPEVKPLSAPKVVPEPKLVTPTSTNVDERPPTEKQIGRLHAIATSKGWSSADLKEYSRIAFNKESSKELTRDEYEAFCDFLLSQEGGA